MRKIEQLHPQIAIRASQGAARRASDYSLFLIYETSTPQQFYNNRNRRRRRRRRSWMGKIEMDGKRYLFHVLQ